MIELLIDIGYNWLYSAWKVSTILLPIAIASQVLVLYSKNKLDLEAFQDSIHSNSRNMLALIIILGILTSLTSISELIPENLLLGEIIALTYLAYLFYKY